MKILQLFVSLVALLFAIPASATVTLDFENFLAGQIINDEYFAPFGVTVSAVNVGNSPDVAVIFDSNNPTGGDFDLAGPFAPGPGNPFGQQSPGNLLILHETANCAGDFCPDPDDQGARPSGTIRFDFLSPVLVGSIDLFDIEPGETGEIVLYGLGNAVLATFAIPSTGGDNQWQHLMMDVTGVSAMAVNLGGSGAIDNLTFSAVPLPATILLLLGALAPLGFMQRRNG